MKISRLELTNIRSFVDQHYLVCADNINLLVGKNNSGKSTIIKSILMLQEESLQSEDTRLDKHQGRITVYLKKIHTYTDKFGTSEIKPDTTHIEFNFTKGNTTEKLAMQVNQTNFGFGRFHPKEPKNLIYPYLSNRKVVSYDENVNSTATNSVTGNFQYLNAKINRLCKLTEPKSQDFISACEKVLEFPISTVDSPAGQRAAYPIDTFTNILMTSMGDGIPNLVGLIADLCVAENKIFLIEEPENDIHPKALKALLDLIVEKSQNNQFFISTHSNIVTKYLGSVTNSKIFRVSCKINKGELPVSEVAEVPNEETARRELLEELGYEFQDYDLHKAWLFLEESSAEVVIRDFLIPNFAKKLQGKLKTFSANGVDKVKPKIDDFNNLFVFLNLQPIYKNKVWVVIDAGENESNILSELKAKYCKNGWNEDKFMQFTERNFEMYYPETFRDKVSKVLATPDKGLKRTSKQKLIEEVKQWWNDNTEQAKIEFKESAKEVIEILKKIEKEL